GFKTRDINILLTALGQVRDDISKKSGTATVKQDTEPQKITEPTQAVPEKIEIKPLSDDKFISLLQNEYSEAVKPSLWASRLINHLLVSTENFCPKDFTGTTGFTRKNTLSRWDKLTSMIETEFESVIMASGKPAIEMVNKYITLLDLFLKHDIKDAGGKKITNLIDAYAYLLKNQVVSETDEPLDLSWGKDLFEYHNTDHKGFFKFLEYEELVRFRDHLKAENDAKKLKKDKKAFDRVKKASSLFTVTHRGPDTSSPSIWKKTAKSNTNGTITPPGQSKNYPPITVRPGVLPHERKGYPAAGGRAKIPSTGRKQDHIIVLRALNANKTRKEAAGKLEKSDVYVSDICREIRELQYGASEILTEYENSTGLKVAKILELCKDLTSKKGITEKDLLEAIITTNSFKEAAVHLNINDKVFLRRIKNLREKLEQDPVNAGYMAGQLAGTPAEAKFYEKFKRKLRPSDIVKLCATRTDNKTVKQAKLIYDLMLTKNRNKACKLSSLQEADFNKNIRKIKALNDTDLQLLADSLNKNHPEIKENLKRPAEAKDIKDILDYIDLKDSADLAEAILLKKFTGDSSKLKRINRNTLIRRKEKFSGLSAEDLQKIAGIINKFYPHIKEAAGRDITVSDIKTLDAPREKAPAIKEEKTADTEKNIPATDTGTAPGILTVFSKSELCLLEYLINNADTIPVEGFREYLKHSSEYFNVADTDNLLKNFNEAVKTPESVKFFAGKLKVPESGILELKKKLLAVENTSKPSGKTKPEIIFNEKEQTFIKDLTSKDNLKIILNRHNLSLKDVEKIFGKSQQAALEDIALATQVLEIENLLKLFQKRRAELKLIQRQSKNGFKASQGGLPPSPPQDYRNGGNGYRERNSRILPLNGKESGNLTNGSMIDSFNNVRSKAPGQDKDISTETRDPLNPGGPKPAGLKWWDGFKKQHMPGLYKSGILFQALSDVDLSIVLREHEISSVVNQIYRESGYEKALEFYRKLIEINNEKESFTKEELDSAKPYLATMAVNGIIKKYGFYGQFAIDNPVKSIAATYKDFNYPIFDVLNTLEKYDQFFIDLFKALKEIDPAFVDAFKKTFNPEDINQAKRAKTILIVNEALRTYGCKKHDKLAHCLPKEGAALYLRNRILDSPKTFNLNKDNYISFFTEIIENLGKIDPALALEFSEGLCSGPEDPKYIVISCSKNEIRSPFAEYIANKIISRNDNYKDYTVVSAGIDAREGAPNYFIVADKTTDEPIDSKKKTRALSPELVEKADIAFIVPEHYQEAVERYPGHADKILPMELPLTVFTVHEGTVELYREIIFGHIEMLANLKKALRGYSAGPQGGTKKIIPGSLVDAHKAERKGFENTQRHERQPENGSTSSHDSKGLQTPSPGGSPVYFEFGETFIFNQLRESVTPDTLELYIRQQVKDPDAFAQKINTLTQTDEALNKFAKEHGLEVEKIELLKSTLSSTQSATALTRDESMLLKSLGNRRVMRWDKIIKNASIDPMALRDKVDKLTETTDDKRSFAKKYSISFGEVDSLNRVLSEIVQKTVLNKNEEAVVNRLKNTSMEEWKDIIINSEVHLGNFAKKIDTVSAFDTAKQSFLEEFSFTERGLTRLKNITYELQKSKHLSESQKNLLSLLKISDIKKWEEILNNEMKHGTKDLAGLKYKIDVLTRNEAGRAKFTKDHGIEKIDELKNSLNKVLNEQNSPKTEIEEGGIGAKESESNRHSKMPNIRPNMPPHAKLHQRRPELKDTSAAVKSGKTIMLAKGKSITLTAAEESIIALRGDKNRKTAVKKSVLALNIDAVSFFEKIDKAIWHEAFTAFKKAYGLSDINLADLHHILRELDEEIKVLQKLNQLRDRKDRIISISNKLKWTIKKTDQAYNRAHRYFRIKVLSEQELESLAKQAGYENAKDLTEAVKANSPPPNLNEKAFEAGLTITVGDSKKFYGSISNIMTNILKQDLNGDIAGVFAAKLREYKNPSFMINSCINILREFKNKGVKDCKGHDIADIISIYNYMAENNLFKKPAENLKGSEDAFKCLNLEFFETIKKEFKNGNGNGNGESVPELLSPGFFERVREEIKDPDIGRTEDLYGKDWFEIADTLHERTEKAKAKTKAKESTRVKPSEKTAYIDGIPMSGKAPKIEAGSVGAPEINNNHSKMPVVRPEFPPHAKLHRITGAIDSLTRKLFPDYYTEMKINKAAEKAGVKISGENDNPASELETVCNNYGWDKTLKLYKHILELHNKENIFNQDEMLAAKNIMLNKLAVIGGIEKQNIDAKIKKALVQSIRNAKCATPEDTAVYTREAVLRTSLKIDCIKLLNDTVKNLEKIDINYANKFSAGAAGKPVVSILHVCELHQVRSTAAEYFTNLLLFEKYGDRFTVESAGTNAIDGQPTAFLVDIEGISSGLTGISRKLTPEMIEKADVVFAAVGTEGTIKKIIEEAELPEHHYMKITTGFFPRSIQKKENFMPMVEYIEAREKIRKAFGGNLPVPPSPCPGEPSVTKGSAIDQFGMRKEKANPATKEHNRLGSAVKPEKHDRAEIHWGELHKKVMPGHYYSKKTNVNLAAKELGITLHNSDIHKFPSLKVYFDKIFETINERHGWDKAVAFYNKLLQINTEKGGKVLSSEDINEAQLFLTRIAVKNSAKANSLELFLMDKFTVEATAVNFREAVLLNVLPVQLVKNYNYIQIFSNTVRELEKLNTALAFKFKTALGGGYLENILFVCEQNKLRSQGAEFLVNMMLDKKYGRRFSVKSAGTRAYEGAETACMVQIQGETKCRKSTTKKLTPALIKNAHMVFVTPENYKVVFDMVTELIKEGKLEEKDLQKINKKLFPPGAGMLYNEGDFSLIVLYIEARDTVHKVFGADPIKEGGIGIEEPCSDRHSKMPQIRPEWPPSAKMHHSLIQKLGHDRYLIGKLAFRDNEINFIKALKDNPSSKIPSIAGRHKIAQPLTVLVRFNTLYYEAKVEAAEFLGFESLNQFQNTITNGMRELGATGRGKSKPGIKDAFKAGTSFPEKELILASGEKITFTGAEGKLFNSKFNPNNKIMLKRDILDLGINGVELFEKIKAVGASANDILMLKNMYPNLKGKRYSDLYTILKELSEEIITLRELRFLKPDRERLTILAKRLGMPKKYSDNIYYNAKKLVDSMDESQRASFAKIIEVDSAEKLTELTSPANQTQKINRKAKELGLNINSTDSKYIYMGLESIISDILNGIKPSMDSKQISEFAITRFEKSIKKYDNPFTPLKTCIKVLKEFKTNPKKLSCGKPVTTIVDVYNYMLENDLFDAQVKMKIELNEYEEHFNFLTLEFFEKFIKDLENNMSNGNLNIDIKEEYDKIEQELLEICNELYEPLVITLFNAQTKRGITITGPAKEKIKQNAKDMILKPDMPKLSLDSARTLNLNAHYVETLLNHIDLIKDNFPDKAQKLIGKLNTLQNSIYGFNLHRQGELDIQKQLKINSDNIEGLPVERAGKKYHGKFPAPIRPEVLGNERANLSSKKTAGSKKQAAEPKTTQRIYFTEKEKEILRSPINTAQKTRIKQDILDARLDPIEFAWKVKNKVDNPAKRANFKRDYGLNNRNCDDLVNILEEFEAEITILRTIREIQLDKTIKDKRNYLRWVALRLLWDHDYIKKTLDHSIKYYFKKLTPKQQERLAEITGFGNAVALKNTLYPQESKIEKRVEEKLSKTKETSVPLTRGGTSAIVDRSAVERAGKKHRGQFPVPTTP
ncbi:MAG: hypothetical protein ABIH00_10520, partial [Armatimonadota bacterium]